MCRACYDANGNRVAGRRCPSDNSQARKARRYAAAIATRNQPLPQTATAPAVVEAVQHRPADVIRTDLQNALTNRDATAAVGFVRELGASVIHDAEQFGLYDDPTPAEDRANFEAFQARMVAEYEKYEQLKNTLWSQSGLQDREAFESAWNQVKDRADTTTDLSEADREAYDTLGGDTDELREALRIYRERRDSGENIGGAYVTARLAVTTEALHAALQANGVQFGEESDMVVKAGGNKKGVDTLKSVARYFPKAWLDNSAKSQSVLPLWVGVQQTRAHYIGRKQVTRKKATGDLEPVFSYTDNDSFPDAIPVEEWNEKHPQHKINPSSMGTHVIPSYVYSYEEKKGKNWEKITRTSTDYRTGEKVEKPVWRRVKTERKSHEWERTERAEIVLSPGYDLLPGENPHWVSRRVAMHEFSHRVEATSPHVRMLEQEFIRSRTTLPDGSREKRVALFPGEYVYRDHFHEYYVGKTYEDSSTEVLSIGMESVFGGSYGDFFDDRNPAVDKDLRNFIVGMLASTGNR